MPWYWIVALVAFSALLLLFMFGTFMERTRGVRFRPGWCCGVVGLRGGGKSLFVSRLIARRLEQGVPVVANFAVAGGVSRMESWEDVILAPRGSMVVLDEAHQWAKAQAGKSPDPMADWYVSHSRKLGHELWWIAQHESQVASFVRNQTNEYVSCEEWIGGLHRATSFAPHDFRKSKVKPLWAWWYSPKGAAIRVYDTFELVEPVINPRDSVEVVAQKQQLREMIREINYRRGVASGAIVPEQQETASDLFPDHADGLSFSGDDDTAFAS